MKYCGKERGSITLFLALILSLLLDSMTGNFLRNMICLRWMVPWEAGSLISQRSAIIWNPI